MPPKTVKKKKKKCLQQGSYEDAALNWSVYNITFKTCARLQVSLLSQGDHYVYVNWKQILGAPELV